MTWYDVVVIFCFFVIFLPFTFALAVVFFGGRSNRR